jgi:hypothetical protein
MNQKNSVMRNTTFCVCMILVALTSKAQDNSFPSSGNTLLGTTNITSQKLQVNGIIDIVGNTSARAIRFYDGTNFSGGIGNNLWALGGSYGDLALYSPYNIVLGVNNYERFRISNNGDVGIGIASPNIGGVNRALTLNSATSTNASYELSVNGVLQGSFYTTIGLNGVILGNHANGPTLFVNGSAERGRITSAGRLLWNTTSDNGTDAIQVNGSIKAKKLTITQTSWPDYVFDSSYTLRSLIEVEKFIQHNKHLPEMPSAKEVEEKGINLGDNQTLLLKKIEELTLYMIDLKKENMEHRKLIQQLSQKISKLTK